MYEQIKRCHFGIAGKDPFAMYQKVQYELHELEKLFANDVSRVHEPTGLFAAVPKPDFVRKEAVRIRQSSLQNAFIFEEDSISLSNFRSKFNEVE